MGLKVATQNCCERRVLANTCQPTPLPPLPSPPLSFSSPLLLPPSSLFRHLRARTLIRFFTDSTCAAVVLDAADVLTRYAKRSSR